MYCITVIMDIISWSTLHNMSFGSPAFLTVMVKWSYFPLFVYFVHSTAHCCMLSALIEHSAVRTDQKWIWLYLANRSPFRKMLDCIPNLQIGLESSPLFQWPLTSPRCPPRFSIVFKAVISPPPVTSPLLPHRQLLSPSIFNAHYLEMNGHLQMLRRHCCYIIANMGLQEQHE